MIHPQTRKRLPSALYPERCGRANATAVQFCASSLSASQHDSICNFYFGPGPRLVPCQSDPPNASRHAYLIVRWTEDRNRTSCEYSAIRTLCACNLPASTLLGEETIIPECCGRRICSRRRVPRTCARNPASRRGNSIRHAHSSERVGHPFRHLDFGYASANC